MAAPDSAVGIVLMHGKTGQPSVFSGIVGPLRQAGYLVETPEMPWSKARYIDKLYEDALNEIDLSVNTLKQKGATRIVIAGHSMGANAAIAYAAYHGGVDAVILLAPGHSPDAQGSVNLFASDVAKAKAMMDKGDGAQNSSFSDSNNGQYFTRIMKADIYYSFFQPDGIASMRKSASLLPANLPVLYVAGSEDPLTARNGKTYLYNLLPENALTRYVVVKAPHMGTPGAAIGEMLNWLAELVKQ